MLAFLLLVLNQSDVTTSMQFAKIDSLGKNPITGAQVIYKESVKDRLVQNFQKAPVYLMIPTKDNKEQLIQVGTVNCVYGDSKWMTASLNIKKEIPPNYVLRAVFVHNDSETKNNVEVVTKASITEFVLKPKDKSTIFE
jgi:hypothetical protein